MSRSIKKGPYVNQKLVRRVEEMNADQSKKKVLKKAHLLQKAYLKKLMH